ncbi:uncharacterized protein J3D65DRAFT_642866 [Phyllosticta citribraziliensis]|uniref:Secreted protein n=1 Tax=Phyllosticta citribraziliensis TaxID=989973 RepID=A0ABR1L1W2_9PEZI
MISPMHSLTILSFSFFLLHLISCLHPQRHKKPSETSRLTADKHLLITSINPPIPLARTMSHQPRQTAIQKPVSLSLSALASLRFASPKPSTSAERRLTDET